MWDGPQRAKQTPSGCCRRFRVSLRRYICEHLKGFYCFFSYFSWGAGAQPIETLQLRIIVTSTEQKRDMN